MVVCRYLSFLQPFEDVRKGSAKASTSILQKYTSLPPQLALISGVRNRHFRLASLSFAATLANILTIGLSVVFAIRQITMPGNPDATQVYFPTIDLSVVEFSKSFKSVGTQATGTDGEPFQSLLSNLIAGTPLLAWTTKDRYYLSVNLPLAPNDSSNYSLTTLGFEGSSDCTVPHRNAE